MKENKKLQKIKKKVKLKNYDYESIVRDNKAFLKLKDLLGFNNAVELLSELPKDEVEYALDTEDISRVIRLPEYEERRIRYIIKRFSKHSKYLNKMYNTIIEIKRTAGIASETPIDYEEFEEEGDN